MTTCIIVFFLFIYLLEIDEFTFKELFPASAKDLFKGHSMEPENEPFIYSLTLFELFIYGKIRVSFIDSDVLYRGVLSDRFEYTWHVSQYHKI